MKQKMTYFAPETELMDVRVEQNFLGSAETMTTVGGTWDNEEDW